MNRFRAAFFAIGVLALGFGTMAAGARDSRPGERRPILPAEGGASDEPTKVADVVEMVVWRNGEYHTIKVHPRFAVAEAPDGKRIGRATLSSTEAEAQLPPVDPALNHLRPTPEQAARAKGAHGVGSLPPPPPNRR